jgi:hypothetical protein
MYHMYGTAEIKKIDTKSIGFDFEFFETLSGEEFIREFESELGDFVQCLLNENIEGKSSVSN